MSEKKSDRNTGDGGPAATMLRPMKFLEVECCQLRHVETGEIIGAFILRLDNQGDRPDDLISISLSEEDASDLHEQLGKYFDGETDL